MKNKIINDIKEYVKKNNINIECMPYLTLKEWILILSLKLNK